MKKLLIELGVCENAIRWAGQKSWQEIFETCYRGDWLLSLFAKTNPKDIRQLTLAKGHCADAVRYLMSDERSINAVDVAISFGNGTSSMEDLHAVCRPACLAYQAAAENSSIKYVHYAAARAAFFAAKLHDAAHTNAAALVAYETYYIAESNKLKTANICRRYLPIEIWNISIVKA